MDSAKFLKNVWYVAALDEEVSADKILSRIICGEAIAFYRTPEGEVVALEDRCCHKSLPLHMGFVEGANLRCGYHGMLFNQTGKCISIPGQDVVPSNAQVKSYPVHSKQGWVWIWMGDKALADPANITDYHWLDAPGWGAKSAHIHVKANYRLVVENLLDLTHLTYVHGRTIGNAAVIDDAKVDFALGEREVKVTRWMMDVPPPPSYVRAAGFEGNIDRWMIVHYAPPGFCRLYTGGADAGSGIREGKATHRMDWRNLNAVTPETETTSHYFWGQAQAHDPDNQAVTDLVFDQVRVTFLEDLAIFEAQQETINRDPSRPVTRFVTKADAGGRHAMRVLDRLLAEQAEGKPAIVRPSDLRWGPDHRDVQEDEVVSA